MPRPPGILPSSPALPSSRRVTGGMPGNELVAGPVKPLGDRVHDGHLHLGPVVNDLSITDPYDVVAVKGEQCIVLDVLLALSVDVVAPIDLEHEPVSDQEVNAMVEDPGLRNQTEPEPTKSGDEIRLQSRVREWLRNLRKRAGSRGERQAREFLQRDEPLVQGRLPHDQCVVMRKTGCDGDERVADAIDE